MNRTREPLPPYATPEELAQGRRRAVLLLAIGAAALVLAYVARHYVDDQRLVQAYLLAGGMHLLAAIGPILRITRTGELGPAD